MAFTPYICPSSIKGKAYSVNKDEERKGNKWDSATSLSRQRAKTTVTGLAGHLYGDQNASLPEEQLVNG